MEISGKRNNRVGLWGRLRGSHLMNQRKGGKHSVRRSLIYERVKDNVKKGGLIRLVEAKCRIKFPGF